MNQTPRQLKRGQDIKIPQSSSPPEKVGDEAVHKELGDRMERAATTASSLEAEQDSANLDFVIPTTWSLTYSNQREVNIFHQIVDFLHTSHIKYALTENPTIHVIQQFWQTASASTNKNGEMEITTTINGRVKTVTEASIRRHLKLDDSDGISTLPNTKIFEQLALIGTYIAPTLTHKLFSNMRRASKGYTGVDIPLFPIMLVQGPNLQGQGSTIQSDSHHSTTSAPSTSKPPTSPPSMQTTHVAEEAATLSHGSPLLRVHSLGSDKGSMTHHEWMLIMKVKRLEKEVKLKKSRRRAKIVVSDDEDAEKDTSKQGRSKIKYIDQDAGVSLVQIDAKDQGRFEDETDTQVSAHGEAHSQGSQPEDQLGVFSAAKILADVARVHTYSRRRRIVSTGSGEISTAEESVSTTGDSMPVNTASMDQGSIPSPSASKDKGKAIMPKSEPEQATTKLKQRQEIVGYEAAIRLQEQLDEEESNRIARDAEVSQRLQEEIDASERQRMAQVQQAAQGFTDGEWDDILARVAADEDLVKEIFEATMRRVQSFVPMDSELEVQRLKRAGQEIFKETAKRQNIEEASGSSEEQLAKKEKELSEEELQKLMMIVPVEEVYVEALQRELDKLWSLVKERFSSTDPTDDKERILWVELKRLFEPDIDDILWKLQRYMHDPLTWRLYDTCGVHHVSTDRGHDIFMLVKKDYPLTRGLMIVMLANKLQVDQSSEMANELLRKIFIHAERPRQ
ncbi:hypothetical protein Tco_1570529 [Tanacetum coccineum]